MKNIPDNLVEIDGELLKDARFLYRHFTRVLTAAISDIEASGSIEAKDSEHQALVRKHHNALLQLINLEADLVKRSGNTKPAFAGTELDLDAARAEISSRLAKLAARRGGEDVS